MKRALLAALGLAAVTAGGFFYNAYGPSAPAGIVVEEGRYRDGRARWGREGPPSGAAGPIFEFAPASGAGMGALCAGTVPTGSRGEVLTFVRASGTTCSKHFGDTGIATGDIVDLAADQPRVMPDATGRLKVLFEENRTFSMLRNEQIDHVAWSSTGAVVIDGGCPAPNGTTTADLVSFPATTTLTNAGVYQGPAIGGPASAGVFMMGSAATPTGTLDISINNGVSNYCSSCLFVSNSWTWCKVENVPINATYVSVGNISANCGVAARPAQQVILWRPSVETGATATLPLKTLDAPVIRGPDGALIGAITIAPDTKNLTVSGVYVTPNPLSTSGDDHSDDGTQQTPTPWQLYFGANSREDGHLKNSGELICAWRHGDRESLTSVAPLTAGAANAISCGYAGDVLSNCLNGTCRTAVRAYAKPTGSATIRIGRWFDQFGFASNLPNGLIGEVSITAAGGLGRVGWIGDSLSTSGASTRYQTVTGRASDNWSVGGSTLSACQTQWTTNGRSFHTRLVVWCGTNDIIGGGNGTTLWNSYQTFIESVRAAGVQVVMVSLTPWKTNVSWTAGKQVELNAFNAAQAAYAALHPEVLYVNMYPVWEDPGAADTLLAAYDSGDHLHPNSTGATAAGTAIAAGAP